MLTPLEKKILTLSDDASKENIFEGTRIYSVNITLNEIQKIIELFLKKDLLEVIEINGKKVYFHTKKVTEKDLDKELQYRIRYGTKPPVTKSSSNLENKLKK